MFYYKWMLAGLITIMSSTAAAKIKIITTFSDFETIAEAIGGDKVEVDHLSDGDDPHFVPPKPSLAIKLKNADMLVSTGMDLEMWLTTLQDKARNKNTMDGAPGFVTVSPGIEILEKPAHTISRSEGDVHINGNPHFHTSPLNWIEISENILIGLKKVDPQNADFYTENQANFVNRVYCRMFGDELVNLFGGKQLADLQRSGNLMEFLKNDYQGEPIMNRLGGWMQEAMPFRGLSMVAYHKNWAYFAKEFGLNIVGFIESKPGIPPTPKHVEDTILLIKNRHISIMLVASYFERRKPLAIAQKTGIQAVFLPLSVGAVEGTEDNFKLMDYWICQINQAIGHEE